MSNFPRPPSTPFYAHYCVSRPITSLGHQGGEEFSERRTDVLSNSFKICSNSFKTMSNSFKICSINFSFFPKDCMVAEKSQQCHKHFL